MKHLGTFDTAEEAAMVYAKAWSKHTATIISKKARSKKRVYKK